VPLHGFLDFVNHPVNQFLERCTFLRLLSLNVPLQSDNMLPQEYVEPTVVKLGSVMSHNPCLEVLSCNLLRPVPGEEFGYGFQDHRNRVSARHGIPLSPMWNDTPLPGFMRLQAVGHN
jgi:hypothetical protein